MTALRSTSPTTAPGGRLDAPTRATARTAAAAVAASAAFTAGCALTQAVTVPAWRAMEPTAFLRRFAVSGPATGAVLFPVEVAAVVLLGATTRTTTAQRRPGRWAWAGATAAMAATVALLPVYFARANTALLDPAFPPDDVPAELRRWNGWNWGRTALAAAATVSASRALTDLVHRDRP